MNNRVNELLDLRDNISASIKEMTTILEQNFPKQFADAYQHWIPQILTALYNDTKWLPRGNITFQDTIDRINDSNDCSGGVSKYIQ